MCKTFFYMARSARVVLPQFALTSENRRISKKFDGVFDKKRIPLKEFNIEDEAFLSFCVEYFKPNTASAPRRASVYTIG